MTGCRLDQNRRNEAIQRFERILSRHNLKFVNEITVAPVSRIGVPNPAVLLRIAWGSGWKWLIITRMLMLIFAGALLLIDVNTYLHITISLIASSLTFAWLDGVLFWMQEREPKNKIAWIATSITFSFFIALGIGWPTGIITPMIITIDPSRAWEFYLMAIISDTVLSFFGSFGMYWLFMATTNSDRILFEERFVAVRKCLRSKQRTARISSEIHVIEGAKRMEIALATLKCILLWSIPLLVFVIRPILSPLQIGDTLSMVATVSLAGLVLFGCGLIYTGSRVNMPLRTAITTMIVVTFIASLLIASSNLEPFFLIVCYVIGVILLVVLLKSYGRLISEKPEVLGQGYFERYLFTLENDDAERFIDDTIQLLDTLIAPIGT